MPRRHVGGVNVQLLSFITLAMDGGELSDSCPRYFNVERERGVVLAMH